jgi:hypothetical protein
MHYSRKTNELHELRQSAQALAQSRKERCTTAHLLVALSERPGPASDLLTGRRLSRQDLLLAARAASDDQPDALEGSLRQAREIADRVRAPASVRCIC